MSDRDFHVPRVMEPFFFEFSSYSTFFKDTRRRFKKNCGDPANDGHDLVDFGKIVA
jgi:hypothetical protein